MNIRKLKADEVTFEVTIEPEHIEVRGNAMCSGDSRYDKRVEDRILRDLDNGYQEVWCCLVVTAEWEGIKGRDTLGCCSFRKGDGRSVEKQSNECAKEHGMFDRALENLNEELQRQAEKCSALLAKLKVKPTRTVAAECQCDKVNPSACPKHGVPIKR